MKNTMAVIVTYNVGIEFVDKIEVLKNYVDKIVVVDNGSNSNTLKILKSLKDTIILTELNENKGIAYALNRGIEQGVRDGYEWILTLDHDSIVEKDMVSNMLKTYSAIDDKEKDKIVMITPIHIEEKKYNKELVSKNNAWKYVLTEITSGALTKASYYKNNIYDEDLFIDLVDHDYCLNINKQGYKIIQVESAILIHNLGESVQRNILGMKVTPTNHNALRRYYMARNRFFIWNKYKDDFPEWIAKDKKRFISELAKVILFENNKVEKIKMTITGIKDYKKGIRGDFNR